MRLLVLSNHRPQTRTTHKSQTKQTKGNSTHPVYRASFRERGKAFSPPPLESRPNILHICVPLGNDGYDNSNVMMTAVSLVMKMMVKMAVSVRYLGKGPSVKRTRERGLKETQCLKPGEIDSSMVT